MKLTLDEEQSSVQETARRFFSASSPVAVLRRIRDEFDPLGYDAGVWRQLVDLGFAGLTIPEACGGLGQSYTTLGAVFEESGRTLCASPLFSSLVLGASVIECGGSESQRARWLPAVAQGSLTLALALDEGSRHEPFRIQCAATRVADGYRLDGRKTLVLDGASAQQIIVVARSSGLASDEAGLSLFLVDRHAAGLNNRPMQLVDSRNMARLELLDVRVGNDARLGEEGSASAVLEPVLDRARAVLAAEMLGGSLELFERTMNYLRLREQFGVKIGSFQALKHRAARLYIEIQLLRSAVMAALSAIDEQAENRSALISVAKARANDVYQLASNEATQMHGGVGVTDDLDVGLFLKRSRVSTQCFGDSRFHRNRFATAQGY